MTVEWYLIVVLIFISLVVKFNTFHVFIGYLYIVNVLPDSLPILFFLLLHCKCFYILQLLVNYWIYSLQKFSTLQLVVFLLSFCYGKLTQRKRTYNIVSQVPCIISMVLKLLIENHCSLTTEELETLYKMWVKSINIILEIKTAKILMLIHLKINF